MDSSLKSVLIVEAKFYPEISIDLADGAISVLDAKGFSFERVEVPGIFEIPQATKMFWESGSFAGGLDSCLPLCGGAISQCCPERVMKLG